MKTSDLIDHVAATAEIDKRTARKAVDAVLTGIAEAAKTEEVILLGFGRFKLKESLARQGRNPSTGAVIDIPAGKKLTFTQAAKLKASYTE